MRYEIIYADPPWAFRVWGLPTAGRRTAASHYPTMGLPEIMDLQVRDIAAPDCALFLWATMPTLPGALDVIRAWGFEYKTAAFVWVKRNRSSPGWHLGMGFWTRSNSELCLLATRGRPRRVSASVRQVVDAPVARHSAKPPEVRARIEALLGERRRIELFARERADGWDALGWELDRLPIQKSLQAVAVAAAPPARGVVRRP